MAQEGHGRKSPESWEKGTDDYIDEELVNGRIFRSRLTRTQFVRLGNEMRGRRESELIFHRRNRESQIYGTLSWGRGCRWPSDLVVSQLGVWRN